MGSMAFWYEKAPASTKKLSAVMNFNLWTQCAADARSFLDIGFLLSNISAATKLFYYIPFRKENVVDLSKKINRSKAIGAIFNEKYSVVDIPESSRFWPVENTAEHSSQRPEFVIYSWDNVIGDDTVVCSEVDGCDGVCIEIDVKKILSQIENTDSRKVCKDDKFYFRFRVQIPDAKQDNTIVRKYSPANSFLQSTLSTTYIVDFRFDDMRSLPDCIGEKIVAKANDFVDISKLHFFLMTKAHVDVETGAKDISLRELEDNTWDAYIDNKFAVKDIVAFHCSEKQSTPEKAIRQWEFFAKLKVNNSTFKVVVTYLLVLAISSVAFNIISNLLWEWLLRIFKAK